MDPFFKLANLFLLYNTMDIDDPEYECTDVDMVGAYTQGVYAQGVNIEHTQQAMEIDSDDIIINFFTNKWII